MTTLTVKGMEEQWKKFVDKLKKDAEGSNQPEEKSEDGAEEDDDRAVPGRLPHQLQSWWEHGEGATKIKWGVKGDFDRCVRLAIEEAHMTPNNAKGFCANRHYGALGKWPGQEHKEE